VAAATRDADSSEYGGIYLIEDEAPFPGWTDAGIGSYDVYSLALSPHFADDEIITAAVSDESSSYVAYNYGNPGQWNLVELLDAASTSFALSEAAKLCLASDFSEPYPLFVGVAGGDGGLYQVDKNQAQRLSGIDTDIISLDLADGPGTARLMAGERDSTEVWYSSDGGASWSTAVKAPSGSGPSYVVMADDFTSSGRAYAATSGPESAVSATSDGGATWNDRPYRHPDEHHPRPGSVPRLPPGQDPVYAHLGGRAQPVAEPKRWRRVAKGLPVMGSGGIVSSAVPAARSGA
jgi:hypothetical protein